MMFNAVAAHVQLKGIRTESLSRNTYTQNKDQNALNTQKKKILVFGWQMWHVLGCGVSECLHIMQRNSYARG